jgi:glycosyltransferase involved in cell wall biosynthesis
MKHVVFVSTELGVGGAEKALTEIAVRMPSRGYLPTVVSLRPRPAAGRDRLVKQLEEAGLSVRFLDVTRATQFFTAVSSLRQVLLEKNARLALSFLYHANIITAFASGKNRAVAHFAGIRVAEPNAWRNRIEAWSLSRCSGVICVSQEVKRRFGAYFRDAKRLSVIPNGVASWKEATPADLSSIGIAKEDPIVLFAGRLHSQKGLDWALPQVAKVLEKNPALQFVIAGDGPQMEELERLTLQLPCQERIHFLGFQSDLAPFLARSQCLLLPSRWEGMPNVVLEAMAAGIPVLATERSNAVEILNPASRDQLFGFGDANAMVERLSRLVEDRDLAVRLGAENREKSRQFSWEAISEQYARLFAAIS